jgi:hypothetical protein
LLISKQQFFVFYRKFLCNIPHLQWRYWNTFIHFCPVPFTPFLQYDWYLLLLLLAICSLQNDFWGKGLKERLTHNTTVERKLFWCGNMCENRIMQSIKNCLEKSNRGVNLIKVHCIQVWKYHNETPLYN